MRPPVLFIRAVRGMARAFALAMALAGLALAGPRGEELPSESELVQQCTSGLLRAWMKCECYAASVLRQRQESPAMSEGERGNNAFNACLDEGVVKEHRTKSCLRDKALIVPRGIAETSYCGCFGAEYARAAIAHVPKRHEGGTESDFMQRAMRACGRSVKTPSANAQIADNMLGRWRFQAGELSLDMESSNSDLIEPRATFNLNVSGFTSGPYAGSAMAKWSESPRRFDLEFTSSVPFMPGRFCLATTFDAASVSGRCTVGSGGEGKGFDFKMTRQAAPGSVPTAGVGAAGPQGNVPSPPQQLPAPMPTQVAAPAVGPSSNCPEGRKTCSRSCVALLLKPTIDVAQRALECHQKCKAECTQ